MPSVKQSRVGPCATERRSSDFRRRSLAVLLTRSRVEWRQWGPSGRPVQGRKNQWLRALHWRKRRSLRRPFPGRVAGWRRIRHARQRRAVSWRVQGRSAPRAGHGRGSLDDHRRGPRQGRGSLGRLFWCIRDRHGQESQGITHAPTLPRFGHPDSAKRENFCGGWDTQRAEVFRTTEQTGY